MAAALRPVDVADEFVDAFAPAATRELHRLLERPRATHHCAEVLERGAPDATRTVQYTVLREQKQLEVELPDNLLAVLYSCSTAYCSVVI